MDDYDQHQLKHSRAWSVAVLIAALFALVVQNFTLQTHLHFDPGTYSRATAGSPDANEHLKSGRSSPDLPANCPICKELAYAGHYLPPQQVDLPVPQAVTGAAIIVAIIALMLPGQSRAWNSRAPPLHS